MAEKYTTLSQQEMTALRTRAEVLALLVSAFEGVQVGTTITLPAANWSGRAQTIQNELFLANNEYWYIISLDADSLAEGGQACIHADNITSNGQMTFHCETAPESDLAINIIRLEVEV